MGPWFLDDMVAQCVPPSLVSYSLTSYDILRFGRIGQDSHRDQCEAYDQGDYNLLATIYRNAYENTSHALLVNATI